MVIEYSIDPDTGCHLCYSHRQDKDGYCSICVGGKTTLLHRYIYELVKGKIPEGFVVRHTCDNPNCINPDHLIIGSQE